LGKLTNTVFNESCCDGGECGINDRSAQSCGCDIGANHLCERHTLEAKIRAEFDSGARETAATVLEFLPALIEMAMTHVAEYGTSEDGSAAIQDAKDFVEDFN
jgi:hypothetical protein